MCQETQEQGLIAVKLRETNLNIMDVELEAKEH